MLSSLRPGPLGALPIALLALGCGSSGNSDPFARETALLPPSGSRLVFASNAYAGGGSAPREVYAARGDGTEPVRLTLCDPSLHPCDTVSVAPATDGRRLGIVRHGPDGDALAILDLGTGATGTIVAGKNQVGGVDWQLGAEVLLYSALGEGGKEDLFQIATSGLNNGNLTMTADIRERRPRLNGTGSAVLFERIDSSGKGEVWLLTTSGTLGRIDGGGVAGATLAGTPYVVGADADPDFSPDASAVVFRRLTGLGDGRGTWDIVTVAGSNGLLTTLATGDLYRGPPDWGIDGIVFTETDAATGGTSLVIVQPDGSGRRAALAAPRGVLVDSPRWLP